jgi:LysM repeat protein
MYVNVNRESLETPYYSYYVIQTGDNLYKIAQKFNMNPKLVAELNGLKLEDYIYSNQTIIIPKKGVQYYITKEDDTLKTVSNVFGTSEVNIINQNQSIYLLPGQMIFYKEDNRMVL